MTDVSKKPMSNRVKVVRNKKWKSFLLPNMIELFETSRMSHLPPFYDDFFCRNLTLKIGYFVLW